MKKYSILIITTLLLTACGNEAEKIEVENRSIELKLTCGVEVMSRTNTQATALEAGEKVYVWLDGAEDNAPYLKAWELKAEAAQEGKNAFLGSKQFFPQSGSSVSAYALHGLFDTPFTEGDTEFPEKAGVTCRVMAEQTDADSYIKSDMLYATALNIDNGDGTEVVRTQNLQFYHMLSKVEIAFSVGGGLTVNELQASAVYLNSVKVEALFKPIRNTELTDRAIRTAMLTPKGEGVELLLAAKVIEGEDFTNADFAEAVIVPQTVVAGRFIKVVLPNGTTLYHSLAEEMVFESGKKYVFEAKASLTELQITETTIIDWDKETIKDVIVTTE